MVILQFVLLLNCIMLYLEVFPLFTLTDRNKILKTHYIGSNARKRRLYVQGNLSINKTIKVFLETQH